jgi:hypothetical protein
VYVICIKIPLSSCTLHTSFVLSFSSPPTSHPPSSILLFAVIHVLHDESRGADPIKGRKTQFLHA